MKKINLFLAGFLLIYLNIFFCYAQAAQKGRIAYSRLTDGYWQVWVMDLDTGVEQQVTDSKVDKKNPVWSPDGKRIVCRTSNGELLLIGLIKKDEMKILRKLGYLTDPVWLDDNRLIFVRFRSDLKDDSDIWSANLDGEQVKVITDALGLQYNPAISSSGEKIVYVSAVKPAEHELLILELNTGKTDKLTQNRCYNIYPDLSADNAAVVFSSDKTGNYEIRVMDLVKGAQKMLTSNGCFNTGPVWLDNKYIAFVSNKTGSLQIWMMDKEGSELIQLTRGSECVDPAWHF